ncbi:MAG: cytochrome b/b6 domain-containing protein [Lysobacteraceae bacterium]
MNTVVMQPIKVSPRPVTRVVLRHRWPIRLMHWINALCLFVLLASGFQIFNAHPALYWGPDSTFDHPALAMTSAPGADGKLHGTLSIGTHKFNTTGVLGASRQDGNVVSRGFPSWATLPGARNLALGRSWHFFFAWLLVINGACFLLYAWLSHHASRDLAPTKRDWRGFGRSIIDHLRFKHPHGEEALRYNILQKLAYVAVIYVMAPLIVLMGLSMSPHFDAAFGWLVNLVGGRQSARSIHFIIAVLFVGFIAIHLFEVLISGVFNQLRSMITGYFAVDFPADTAPPQAAPVDSSRITSPLHPVSPPVLVAPAGVEPTTDGERS